jgi:tetratricopeptide (TPR) repeat protein
MSDSDRDRDRARILYTLAREHEARGDYASARELYEQSLKLHEDADARKAYLQLLATLGPM